MGSTGSGKSTVSSTPRKPGRWEWKLIWLSQFINSVLEQERLKVGEGISSCTQNVDMVDIKIHGRVIRLIDTPGFDDTNLSDAEVLERIVIELGIQ